MRRRDAQEHAAAPLQIIAEFAAAISSRAGDFPPLMIFRLRGRAGRGA